MAGTSTTGWCLRALSGQYNTPRVGALKAVINGPCSHDSRVFTQTPLEEVLVLMPGLKPPEVQKAAEQLRPEPGGHIERGGYARAVRPNSSEDGLASEDERGNQELLLGV